MINCHLVHGFNVRDGGKDTIDTLIPFLKTLNLNTVEHNYGHFNIVDVIRKNDVVASRVKNKVIDGDIGIGHSNGCAILVKSAIQGACFKTLILINPALDKKFEFPPNIEKIHVIHNSYDKPVVAAKWLRRLVFWRNSFLWGEMGNTGYKGNDPRVNNIKLFQKHSGAFKKMNQVELNKVIENAIR